MVNFFSKLFNLVKTKKSEVIQTAELERLCQFENAFNNLLKQDIYIARSDYKKLRDDNAYNYSYFKVLRDSKTLSYYCEEHGVEEERIVQFLSNYGDLLNDDGAQLIIEHNNNYLSRHLESEKQYLDTILTDVDPNIKLDAEQRKVVLSDEDYMLVIAGAGAGKTTTVAAKVKYLVEKKGIRPNQILVISFTNKAIGELQDKINVALKINCPVTTCIMLSMIILNATFWSTPNLLISLSFSLVATLMLHTKERTLIRFLIILPRPTSPHCEVIWMNIQRR